MSQTYLMHHGILGQKWGIRRFQNKDGSLTSAGKERIQSTLASSGKEIATMTKEMSKSANTMSKYFQKRATQYDEKKYNASRRKARNEMAKLSNKELQDIITRQNLERQYLDYMTDKELIHKGAKKVSNILDACGTAITLVGSTVTTAAAIMALKQKI